MVTPRPASGLKGTKLPTGWVLGEEVPGYAGKTGGTFCSGYFAERDGERAFIKVIDLMSAVHNSSDFITALNQATAEILAERDVLRLCQDERMSKIIRLVEHGEYEVPGLAGNPLGKVHYFVFERAESDVRKELMFSKNSNVLWKLRVLKDVAIAIDELHRAGVAHQDIKPSNVLLMAPPEDAGDHKLGDLGRAVRMNVAGPHDDLAFPGDVNYAPLSAWYDARHTEWVDRRTASDLYMLGVLVCFLFTGVNLTHLQFSLLPEEQKPPKYNGTFENVLPYLVDAHARALEKTKSSFPEPYADELLALVIELTHPDPRARGNRRARSRFGRPPGTETYVSKFAKLVKFAELQKAA